MKKIILASQSPRRIEMLERYAKDIITYAPDIDEIVDDNDLPQTTVMKIALEKALKIANTCKEKGIIVAADTVVYLDKIMGKPRSYDEGFSMLKALSGKTHKVYTGICIIDNEENKSVIDYEETIVEFYELSDDFIRKYLKTEEYKDKAGAYGIQGYGELLVKGINGCYNNVKGLPLTKLNNLMTKHFNHNLL